MDRDQIGFFREFLIGRLEALVDEGQETVSSLKEYRDQCIDLIDKSAMDQLLSMKTRIRDRESKLINKIMQALIRIDEGIYGICELCEEEISIERLKARPVTTLCIECKTRQEQQERISVYKKYPN